MGKLGRAYKLIIGPKFQLSGIPHVPDVLLDPTILVIPMIGTSIPIPLSLDFDIERTNLSDAGHFVIKIYGLGAANRAFIRKDYNQTGIYMRCELKAGYGDTTSGNVMLTTVCVGNVSLAFSVRQDGWVTQIEGFDGGFDYLNADYNQAWGIPTPISVIVADCLSKLHYVTPGVIGPTALAGIPIQKGETYCGNPIGVIADVTGGTPFIDLQRLHVLSDAEVLIGPIPVISSQTGLLGTPKWQQSFLTLDMVFEPRLMIGQQVIVNSLSGYTPKGLTTIAAPNVNGPWKVVGLKHRGTISETVSGEAAVTSLSLANNGGFFVPVGAA